MMSTTNNSRLQAIVNLIKGGATEGERNAAKAAYRRLTGKDYVEAQKSTNDWFNRFGPFSGSDFEERLRRNRERTAQEQAARDRQRAEFERRQQAHREAKAREEEARRQYELQTEVWELKCDSVWEHSLFKAVMRKHGLSTFRKKRQHKTTVSVKANKIEWNKAWAEFEEARREMNMTFNKALSKMLNELET